MVHLFALLLTIGSLTVLGPGALAPADPGVLEAVEARRVRHGFGLSEVAGPDVVLLAVEDCAHLGLDALLVTEDRETHRGKIVDCQQQAHVPLSELGLVADFSPRQAELGHKQAVIVLWP